MQNFMQITPRGASRQMGEIYAKIIIYTLCLKKNRTPATFCNNSNSRGSVAIDFDKNNR